MSILTFYKTQIGIADIAMPKNYTIHRKTEAAPGEIRTQSPTILFTLITPSSYSYSE